MITRDCAPPRRRYDGDGTTVTTAIVADQGRWSLRRRRRRVGRGAPLPLLLADGRAGSSAVFLASARGWDTRPR